MPRPPTPAGPDLPVWQIWQIENDAESLALLSSTTGGGSPREIMRYFVASNFGGRRQADRYEFFVSAVERLGEERVRAIGVETAIQEERRRRRCRDLGIPNCPECGSFHVSPLRRAGPWVCQDCARCYGEKKDGAKVKRKRDKE